MQRGLYVEIKLQSHHPFLQPSVTLQIPTHKTNFYWVINSIPPSSTEAGSKPGYTHTHILSMSKVGLIEGDTLMRKKHATHATFWTRCLSTSDYLKKARSK